MDQGVILPADAQRATESHTNLIVQTTRLVKSCAQCEAEVLRPFAETYKVDVISTRTLKGFKAAISHDCFICKLIWSKMPNPDQDLVTNYNEDNCEDLLHLNVQIFKSSWGRSIYVLMIYVVQVGGVLSKWDLKDPRHKSYTGIFATLFCSQEFPWEKTIPQSTGHQKLIDLARSWIEDCAVNHQACDTFRTPGWRPSRLIDLNTPGIWRLRSEWGPDNHEVRYTTLSYRWGVDPFTQLRTSTLSQFEAGQPIADLPKTFREAMEVTVLLGLKYIWIDALCIVQDSQSDWLKEGGVMADIYTNSSCTLSATASETPFAGLFRSRSSDRVQVGELSSLPVKLELVDSFVENDYGVADIEASPLFRRGWILQERLLSPRTLHFSETQVYFDCACQFKGDVFQRGLPTVQVSNPAVDDGQPPLAKNYYGRPYHGDKDINVSWYRIVGNYSKCELTQDSDKLAALSGLAAIYSRISKDIYLAGHWKSNLAYTLHWHVQKLRFTRRLRDFGTPSWSWASVYGPIDYPFRDFEGVATSLVRLIGAYTYPLEESPYGAVNGGLLVLEGVAQDLVCLDPFHGLDTETWTKVSSWHCLEDQTHKYARIILDDYKDELFKNMILTFLPLIYVCWEDEDPIKGIVLQRLPGHNIRYQRVGYWQGKLDDFTVSQESQNSSGQCNHAGLKLGTEFFDARPPSSENVVQLERPTVSPVPHQIRQLEII